MHILTADIGGTTSRFALFSVRDKKVFLEKIIRKATARYASFFEILEEIRMEDGRFSFDEVLFSVLALPAPVRKQDDIALTNVTWPIPIASLRRAYSQAPLLVVNDFIAQAYGCLTLHKGDYFTVNEGEMDPEGHVAVIGAGTGLGCDILVPYAFQKYAPLPSEGGHTTFAFLKEEQSFEVFLRKRTSASYITKEMVVSGKGLSLLYEFLTGHSLTPLEVAEKISPSSLTAMLFATFYARACRDFALTVTPSRGLFISGGVAISNPWIVDNDIFRKEFTFSSSHSAFLNTIPVLLLKNVDNGLWGAVHYGIHCLPEFEQTMGVEDSFSYL